MTKQHHYEVTIEWTGARQGSTISYTSYSREFTLKCNRKIDIVGSSDRTFRGDPTLYNPEELLVSAISSCHLLWYLHLCADNNIHIISYVDQATGVMQTDENSSGRFSEVELSPTIIVTKSSDIETAIKLHDVAHEKCFIANSVNFPIKLSPIVKHE